jgi:ectoine hydroxylase-related dioxygenase (phytanoyl-CoA dioxygenase family)
VRTLDEIGTPAPTDGDDWNDEGVVILPGFMPEAQMAAYEDCWRRAHGDGWPAARPEGWDGCTPYLQHREILDLLEPLSSTIASVMGEDGGVHLNLTGWVSTERDWHQDSYLNPPHVGDYYAATWVCLQEQVDPDSGPFQYVPGSHRWPQVTRETIWDLLDGYNLADWPKKSEEVLSPIFEAEIERRGAEIVTHLPQRGDVLIWHGRLLHRGSKPNVPGMQRRTLITHFSGVNHREDMPKRKQHGELTYFVL